MAELVSGWSDDHHVHLIERAGEKLKYMKVPAKWSAFFKGLEDDDRATLARAPEVKGISVDPHGYTRIDFAGRWERERVVRAVEEAAKRRRVESFKEHAPVEILEADVRPLRRLLSDTPTLQISATPRLVWLDLEVDPRGGFEEMRAGNRRILVWSLYRLVNGKEELVAEDVLQEDTHDSERELLGKLYAALTPFDVVLSWNGHDFDFPVLENRTNKLRVKNPTTGRPPVWNRWCWLDHMEVYKKYNQAHESGEERASVALQNVAMQLLGEGKKDFDAKKAWDAWKAGGISREELFRYCSHDTSLMPRIEAKSGFVALHLSVCHVTRCFPDTGSLRATEQCDGFLLSLGAARGYRFPTKQFMEDVEQFDGAYVMEPKKLGAMDNVHVCDFGALYPSIMRTWNMSLDTLVSFRNPEAEKLPKCKLPDREVHFRTDIRGIIPIALDQLQATRDEYSAKADSYPKGSVEQNYYSRLSSALKIVNNSVYGVTGAPASRFYNPVIAEGITQTGKWLIHHVAAVMEATGKLLSLYGDTDSVFAQGLVEIFAQVVKTLNEGWEAMVKGYGCTKSYIKLAFEKTFARLILKGKKCYAGKYEFYKGKKVGPDKKPEVRGLEYKRGDVNRLARQMQYELLKMMLPDALPQPPLPTVEVVREWLLKWREKVLHGELTLEDVTISKSVKAFSEYKQNYTTASCNNKVGAGAAKRSCGYEFPHGKDSGPQAVSKCPRCGTERKLTTLPVQVRVAKLMMDRGEQVTPGTRIPYVVVGGEEGAPDDKMNAVPADDPGVVEKLDRDYYWDKLVYPATQRLLEVVYPQEKWTDTAAQRRKAVKLAEREAKKGEYKDLPLFGAPAASASAPVEPESTRVDSPPPAVSARRRRAPAPLQTGSAEAGEVLLHLVAKGEDQKTTLLEAIVAAARAHPGEALLVVEVELGEPKATARVKTGLRMARTRDALEALQRLEVPGVLKLMN